MRTTLTRRSFGGLTLGLAALSLPRFGRAQSASYANPALLMEPGALIGAVSSLAGGSVTRQDIGLVVVDVRPREDYDAGHIPGAIHLDPNAVVAAHSPVDGALRPVAEIEALLGALGIEADSIVVFYDDRGGFHAARMLWLMEYLGHRNTAVLNGGWSAWRDVGGPETARAEAPDAAVFQSALSPRRHATAEDVLTHRDAPGAVLIDVRPRAHVCRGPHPLGGQHPLGREPGRGWPFPALRRACVPFRGPRRNARARRDHALPGRPRLVAQLCRAAASGVPEASGLSPVLGGMGQ